MVPRFIDCRFSEELDRLLKIRLQPSLTGTRSDMVPAIILDANHQLLLGYHYRKEVPPELLFDNGSWVFTMWMEPACVDEFIGKTFDMGPNGLFCT